MYNILTDILLPYFKRKVSPTIATIRKSMEEEQKQAEVIASMLNTITVSKEETKEIEQSMANMYSATSK